MQSTAISIYHLLTVVVLKRKRYEMKKYFHMKKVCEYYLYFIVVICPNKTPVTFSFLFAVCVQEPSGGNERMTNNI